MNRKLKFTLQAILSVAILAFLFYKVGVGNIFEAFAQFNLWYLPLIIILSVLSFLIGILNLFILVYPIKKSIALLSLTKYYLLSWSLGNIIPAKLGEFSLAFFLKQEGIGLGPGFVVSLLDRLITVFVLAVLAGIGFFLFFTTSQAVYLLSIILLGIIVLLFFMVSSPGRRFIRRVVLRKYEKSFKGFYKTLRYFVKEYPSFLFLNVIVTFLKWLLTAVTIFVTFFAFGRTINLLTILVINSIVMFVTLIPATINGLGLRESAAVYLFAQVGVPSSITASAYVLFLVIMYVKSASILFYYFDQLPYLFATVRRILAKS